MVNLLGGKWKPEAKSTMDAALTLLLEHPKDIEFCIMQTVESGLDFNYTDRVQDRLETEHILRLHLFGSGGDFTLRYDDGEYLWRFVGTALGEGEFKELGGEAYPTELSVDEDREQHALLWGEYDTNRKRWYENIVGSARLTYPADMNYERITIYAKSVIDKEGEVVAYWTYRLAEYSPQQEEKETN